MNMEPKGQDKRYFTRNSETKESAHSRLAQAKQTRQKINELKEEIHFKTGNEFSFKMHSLRAEPDRLVQIDKTDKHLLKQRIIQLNFETLRIEKKLKKMLPPFRINKIRFRSDGTIQHITKRSDLQANTSKVLLLRKYLEKLYRKKEELSKKIQ